MSSSAAVTDRRVRVLYVAIPSAVSERVSRRLEPVSGETVETGQEAAAVVADEPVDCVVVGETGPDSDGIAVAERIREATERLPIVLYTEQGSEERAREAAAAGVSEYLPTSPDRDDGELLVERVRRLAERERERRANASERARLAREHRHLESLFESAPLPVVELDREGEVLRWNRGAEETFGWSSDEALGRFNPIVSDDELEAFEHRLDRLLEGDRVSGAEVVVQTKDGDSREFLLSAAPVADADGEPRSVTAVFNDITAQKRMERRLRELQDTAQQLGVAPSVETISEIATEAAETVLGLEVTGLWRYDDHGHALEPVAVTREGRERIPEIPTFTPGDSLAWAAFEDGDVRVYGDLQTVPGRHNPDSPIRSEIIVPLGDEGVLVTGSAEPRQFSEADVDLFRILGATVEAALVRASREQQLRRQNERLEQFADVLAHDLRNPLTTARGYLDLARESDDPEQFERVEAAHDRIGQLIDDLLTLARADATVDDREPVDVAEQAWEAWALVDTDGLTLEVRTPPTLSGDPGRLRQLFENLFRNAVEHGGGTGENEEGADHAPGAETVTVDALPDGEGFYVEDDGVGICEENREAVLDHGVTFSEEGTGFGLSIVADIARAHGWSVTVAESESGGARFEFGLAEGRRNP